MSFIAISPRKVFMLEIFYNFLNELAKTCALGTLEASLVKDLFLAKMNNNELQLKFCREKNSHRRGLERSDTL